MSRDDQMELLILLLRLMAAESEAASVGLQLRDSFVQTLLDPGCDSLFVRFVLEQEFNVHELHSG